MATSAMPLAHSGSRTVARTLSSLGTAPQSLPSENPFEHIESHVRDEVRWTVEPNEQGARLRDHAVSVFKPAETAEPKGTVVLFHGFTAGPWQYKEMAEQLHSEGFHVYAPRMPGHGLVDESGKPWRKDIPDTGEGHVWNDFIDETIEDAKELGAPVYAVGLSGGGGVALKSAQRHEDVEAVAAMAPFVGGDGIAGALLPVLNVVDMVTFGLFGKLLNTIPLGKAKPSAKDDPTPRTPATLGQALAMYRVGSSVEQLEQPLQLLTTAKDSVSGVRANRKLYQAGDEEGHQNGWYHFPAEEKVKHAMLSRLENPNTSSVETVEEIVSKFLSEGSTSVRLPS
ncbi:MAG: alpha/beta fold hydrolase [Vulcanimicrobiota bacterium]